MQRLHLIFIWLCRVSLLIHSCEYIFVALISTECCMFYYGDLKLFPSDRVFCIVASRERSLNMSKSTSKFLASLVFSESVNI